MGQSCQAAATPNYGFDDALAQMGSGVPACHLIWLLEPADRFPTPGLETLTRALQSLLPLQNMLQLLGMCLHPASRVSKQRRQPK